MKFQYRKLPKGGKYKYITQADYSHAVRLPRAWWYGGPTGDFVQIIEGNRLYIKCGYAWDGPSGPTIDTPSTIRASLVHDALYQLMKEGLLNIKYRKYADDLFKEILIEDVKEKLAEKGGFWKCLIPVGILRAHVWHFFVRTCAANRAKPK